MTDNSDEEYIDYMQERERWLLEENERLREENEKLRTEVMSDYNEGWEEGLSAMKEKNEKLREALEGMIDLAEAANVMDDPAYDTARKTLESNND